ncbi:DUF1329 domain-containing protein [Pseudomonas sp. NFX224]|uniref:DUF1329 domain-containing protein n=1 Tax=Pseudomonas sp. NFX224 TaxID=3402862 RepID=UPI003AFB5DFA
MLNRDSVALAFVVLLGIGPVNAAVSPEKAKELGNTLTPFGAIAAGNKEGTIPAYDANAFNGVRVTNGELGKPTTLTSPFKDERPILRIDAKNMQQYEDKLSEGQRQLLTTRAGYFLNVYPTHRTASYPDEILHKTVANATTCKTLQEGDALDQSCRGGLPFPVPTTGKEVMWNKIATWMGPALSFDSYNFTMTPSGRAILGSMVWQYRDFVYYAKETANPGAMITVIGDVKEPKRNAGARNLLQEYLNSETSGAARGVWVYTPGQRRVRREPNSGYDTPNSTSGGLFLDDEIYLFSGKMDRWDMKLVGKKEMYIPYNGFGLLGERCNTDELLKPDTVNPECERWELHRVWVVEATLKPGARHVHSKRIYYFDEDSYLSGFYEAWDQAGKITRAAYASSFPVPENKLSVQSPLAYYDFNKPGYSVTSYIGNKAGLTLYSSDQKMPERELSPDALQGSGIR